MDTQFANSDYSAFNTVEKRSKVIAAFSLVLIGSAFTTFSFAGATVEAVTKITAIIGFIQLSIYLNGYGRWGALSMLFAMIASMFFIDPASLIPDFSSNSLEAISALAGPEIQHYVGSEMSKQISNVSLLERLLGLLPMLLSLAGCALWFFYKPLKQFQTPIILIAVAAIVGGVIPMWVEQFAEIPQGVLIIIAYSMFIKRISDSSLEKNTGLSALLLMAIGFILSIFILTSNDYLIIFGSLGGVILWLVGVSKMKKFSSDKKGSATFISYGVLMIISLILHLIPGIVGDVLAALLQIPAYIVLAIGAFRFKKNIIFDNKSGMTLLGAIVLISIVPAIIYLFSELVANFVFSICILPFIMVAFRNAISSQSRVFLLAVEPAYDSQATDVDSEEENDNDNDNNNNFFTTPLFYVILGGVILAIAGVVSTYEPSKKDVVNTVIETIDDATENADSPDTPAPIIEQSNNGTFNYVGSIANNAVKMQINISGNSITGEYYYIKYKNKIQLTGEIVGDEYKIQEFVDGKNIGSLTLSKKVSGSLIGLWSNGKKSYSAELTIADSYDSVADTAPFKGSWFVDEKGDYDEESGMTFGAITFALDIDFYSNQDYDKTLGDRNYGIITVMKGMKGGPHHITDFKINGNVAEIKYLDLAESLYSAKLYYNANDKSIRFEDGELLEAGIYGDDDGMAGDLHVTGVTIVLKKTK